MREMIDILEAKFNRLNDDTERLVAMIPTERLYWQLKQSAALFPVNSCGEYVLRSAAAIESAFGGITTRLWDDPFEWTLPEALSTNELLLEYLAEVTETRKRGFAFLCSDEDLSKMIPAPEKLRSIFEIIVEALIRAEHNFGRACAVFSVFSDEKTARR